MLSLLEPQEQLWRAKVRLNVAHTSRSAPPEGKDHQPVERVHVGSLADLHVEQKNTLTWNIQGRLG